MKFVFLVVVLISPISLCAQSVAFTFDDGLDPLTQEKAAEWNQAILDALAEVELQSILFPIGRKVDSAAGMELVRAWSEAGHSIGNHTYTHMNLGSRRTILEDFIADVEKNEALLSNVPGWVNLLRFPLLKEGETVAKRDLFRHWMSAHDYRAAPVSIDSSDWYYSSRYLSWRARNPEAELDAFRCAYLDHLWNRANYYDSLSQQVLDRSIPHIILLHTNAINAAFFADVIAMFREKGWRIIHAEDAFADPVYHLAPDVLPAGESILWSLAKLEGVADLRYPAEASVYEEPILDSLGL